MPAPVCSVEQLAVFHGLTRHVADHGQFRGLDLHTVERGLECVEGRFQQCAVEGPGRVQPAYPDAFRLEPRRKRFDVLDRAADHLVQTVVRGDVHSDVCAFGVHRLDGRRHLFRRREDGGHGARCGFRQ